AVALHSAGGSRNESAALTGRINSPRPGNPSISTPGAIGRPGGNATVPVNPGLIGRGVTPSGNVTGAIAPSGRLEPRKAPVFSSTPDSGTPSASNPGSGISRPAVGYPSGSLQPRSGGVSQFQPQPQPLPVSRFNPRPNVSAPTPTPMPSYRAPSAPRMQSPPAVSASRPSGGFSGNAAPRGGNGGGTALRTRP
ncbi:MAG: hypothetical protein KIT22_05185, partial [Verrucomicrobiae bacterium]|nr:hypothetical protein [Verrucomicrobiae bacterium]